MAHKESPDLLRAPIPEAEIEEVLLRPILYSSRRYYAIVAGLVVLLLGGAGAWAYWLWVGFWPLGLQPPTYWAVLIANFVFWIGLSHSGTLISAILRLSQAEWRRPITRGAELMTVFTVMVAALFPIIHLGRSWVFYFLIPYPNQWQLWPNFRSPLLWDMTAILTYLTGSSLYLFLPLIPDLALLRNRVKGWRRVLYYVFSLGWTGTDSQWKHLKVAIAIMAALIIPVAVSVHSIVSWDFAMTPTAGWHSTIFAPYFVIGAIFSGMSLVITIMSVLRYALGFNTFITVKTLENLAKVLLVASLAWFYFWGTDYLLMWFSSDPAAVQLAQQYPVGPYAPLFWLMLFCNFAFTAPALMIKRIRRSPLAVFLISVLVNIGMYVERFLIVAPPLTFSRDAGIWRVYLPSIWELTVTVASFAGFTLLYVVFAKIFPLMSVWEVKEGEFAAVHKRVGETTVTTVMKVD
jgi:Ni/Fe-hydrogenase subunit HybB-like protein